MTDIAYDATAGMVPTATPPESTNLVPEPSTGPPRRWPWWLALGVAAIAAAGAVVGLSSAQSSRADAQADRDRAQALVVRARDSRAEAQGRQELARDAATEVRLGLAGPVATAENLVQLIDQGLAADRDAQTVGADPGSNTAAGADAYNEAVSRANVVIDQYNAALARLEQQLNEELGIDVPLV